MGVCKQMYLVLVLWPFFLLPLVSTMVVKPPSPRVTSTPAPWSPPTRMVSSVVAVVLGYHIAGPVSINYPSACHPTISISSSTLSSSTTARALSGAVVDVQSLDLATRMRSIITGKKVSELRVGDTLVDRLRSVDGLLDGLQKDIYRDTIDWQAIEVYPKIFRAYTPLFTAYTDRAFPANTEIDVALRYALRYEVGGFYSGVTDFEKAVGKQSQRQAQRAFARMSIAYDHYLKAGDLYSEYAGDNFPTFSSEGDPFATRPGSASQQLNYIAPSIEAPGLQDEVVLLRGPDKGRKGIVLWIFKDEKFSNNIVVKLLKDDMGGSDHSEVRLYPYSLVAKTTPPEVQFTEDLLAAYLASAVSSGIMYPIDSYKTRMQTGKRGVPGKDEGGVFGLWNGVGWFIADPNDAVYVASYGIFRDALLAPVDVTNSLNVFVALVLAGSIGDAIGSFFRVPLEAVWKQFQTGRKGDGFEALQEVLSQEKFQALVVAWIAVLCRDVPFAGLQIALFDVYKTLLSGLDDVGLSVFLQRALWGALAGGTAAFLTTPFDNLTTNLMTSKQSNDAGDADTNTGSSLVVSDLSLTSRLRAAWSSLIKGGLGALYSGALPRTLFYAPAAMIFFSVYETLTEAIIALNSGDIKIKLLENASLFSS